MQNFVWKAEILVIYQHYMSNMNMVRISYYVLFYMLLVMVLDLVVSYGMQLKYVHVAVHLVTVYLFGMQFLVGLSVGAAVLLFCRKK